MRDNLVSAVFDDRSQAERAVEQLRAAGVSDDNISIIARNDDNGTVATDGAGEEVAKDVIGSAALGAGVGTLLGIAALAIPGVGPLVAAGAIASTAVPGAAVTGAAVGAAAGGLTGLLKDHGVSDDDADYYERSINDGGVFVSVDTDDAGVDRQTVERALYDAGGHNSSRARSEAAAI